MKSVFESMMNERQSESKMRKKVKGKKKNPNVIETGMSQGSIIKYTQKVDNQPYEERNRYQKQKENEEAEKATVEKETEKAVRALESVRKLTETKVNQSESLGQVQSLDINCDTTPKNEKNPILREKVEESIEKQKDPSFSKGKGPLKKGLSRDKEGSSFGVRQKRTKIEMFKGEKRARKQTEQNHTKTLGK